MSFLITFLLSFVFNFLISFLFSVLLIFPISFLISFRISFLFSSLISFFAVPELLQVSIQMWNVYPYVKKLNLYQMLVDLEMHFFRRNNDSLNDWSNSVINIF